MALPLPFAESKPLWPGPQRRACKHVFVCARVGLLCVGVAGLCSPKKILLLNVYVYKNITKISVNDNSPTLYNSKGKIPLA